MINLLEFPFIQEGKMEVSILDIPQLKLMKLLKLH